MQKNQLYAAAVAYSLQALERIAQALQMILNGSSPQAQAKGWISLSQ